MDMITLEALKEVVANIERQFPAGPHFDRLVIHPDDKQNAYVVAMSGLHGIRVEKSGYLEPGRAMLCGAGHMGIVNLTDGTMSWGKTAPPLWRRPFEPRWVFDGIPAPAHFKPREIEAPAVVLVLEKKTVHRSRAKRKVDRRANRPATAAPPPPEMTVATVHKGQISDIKCGLVSIVEDTTNERYVFDHSLLGQSTYQKLLGVSRSPAPISVRARFKCEGRAVVAVDLIGVGPWWPWS